MARSRFHREYRLTRILDELIQNLFCIIIFTVFKMSKRAHTDDIAIRGHHRNGFQQVFALVAIHNDTALCFQLPCALVHIEHNHVHTQIARCLLSAQAGTQAVVEENQQASLMLSQILILIAVFLDFKRLSQSCFQITQIVYICKVSHNSFYI